MNEKKNSRAGGVSEKCCAPLGTEEVLHLHLNLLTSSLVAPITYKYKKHKYAKYKYANYRLIV